ncbi:MAG: ATP-binding protein [Deltaproteobacteria bacterium]
MSIWHTYMMERFFTSVVTSDLQALQVSQELMNSAVTQKGYLTYFFQDGDPKWLKELDKLEHSFEIWLKKARGWAKGQKERAILNEIDAQYIRIVFRRNRVIALYKQGQKEEGSKLQQKLRLQFFHIIDLCRQFVRGHEERIDQARKANKEMAWKVSVIAGAALLGVVVLGTILAYTLVTDVLRPIRRLAASTDASEAGGAMDDEVKALGMRFQKLMKDVDQTKSKLEWSREHLQLAEKWALVGKLAAGVAHSIRNPLTSVKMRLFSMERSLALSATQKEDFEVISEEIRHIDTIVNNFLEFARPPKLKMRSASPSDAVDLAVQLLRHRLDSYNAKVEVIRDGRLPEIEADPEQLKEVLVNLMVNACEAMVNGGTIQIQEEKSSSDTLGPVVVIKVSDDGPGIPESEQTRVFQPFFSTKEEGTGLGLSIATRIVEEHRGWLDLESTEGKGATFVITLPAGEA